MGSHYSHLKLEERRKLAKWLEGKMPIAEIADRLGRVASTIHRDIKRDRYTETKSRHGAPVRAIQNTASRTRRG